MAENVDLQSPCWAGAAQWAPLAGESQSCRPYAALPVVPDGTEPSQASAQPQGLHISVKKHEPRSKTAHLNCKG